MIVSILYDINSRIRVPFLLQWTFYSGLESVFYQSIIVSLQQKLKVLFSSSNTCSLNSLVYTILAIKKCNR